MYGGCRALWVQHWLSAHIWDQGSKQEAWGKGLTHLQNSALSQKAFEASGEASGLDHDRQAMWLLYTSPNAHKQSQQGREKRMTDCYRTG